MLMQMLKQHDHVHECLYFVSIHIDLAIYEISSKIGTCIEEWHTFKSLHRIGVHWTIETHRCLGPCHHWCHDNKMFVSYGKNLLDWLRSWQITYTTSGPNWKATTRPSPSSDNSLTARKFYGRRRRFLGEHVLDRGQVSRSKGHTDAVEPCRESDMNITYNIQWREHTRGTLSSMSV